MALRNEQRRSGRAPIDVPVEFTCKGSLDKTPGVARDISLGGMFIETPYPAAFGVAVVVGFTLPGHRSPVLVSGTVRWMNSSGMGIQFGSLGVRETHALLEFQREPGQRSRG